MSRNQLAGLGVVAALTVLAAGCTAAPRPAAPAAAHGIARSQPQRRPSAGSFRAGQGGSAGAVHLPAGLRWPGAFWVPERAGWSIPAVLGRPLRFPALRPGQRCPASHGGGGPVAIAGETGTEFGNGPVRVLIWTSRDGAAGLSAHTQFPPWLGFKTLWFGVPAYQGPFVIRAVRLGHPRPGLPGRDATGHGATTHAGTDDRHCAAQQRAAGLPQSPVGLLGQVFRVLRLAG